MGVNAFTMTQLPAIEIGTQSKIHLIGGEKGGVGKSLTVKLEAEDY